jgi:internalin A
VTEPRPPKNPLPGQTLNNLELIHRHGVLEKARLGAILNDSRCYPADRHDFIIGIMRKFELCFDFPDVCVR